MGAGKRGRALGRLRLAGAAAALAILVAADAATQEGGFEAAGWSGGPERGGETGAFAHCAMRLVYGGGETLRLSLSPEGDLGIDLAASNRWPADGAIFGVAIALDDTDLGDHVAELSDGGELSIRLPFSTSAIDRLGLANLLRIRLAQKTMNFPLPGIDRALPRLLQCLGRALAPRMGPYGPFAAPTAEDAGVASGGAGDEEGTSSGKEAVVALLADAGLGEFALLPDGAAPPGALYAWSDGDTVGALFVVEAGSVSLDLLTALVLSDVAAHCRGDFLHGSLDTTLAGDIPARRGMASCWAPGGARFLTTSAWRGSETMPLVIHRGRTARAVTDSDGKLLDAFAARLR